LLPDQPVGDEDFLAFLRSFGELMFTAGDTPVAGFPGLNVISDESRTTPWHSSFHVDTTYVPRPPAYTALRAVEIPSSDGETVFTNQYLGLESLPPRLRDAVEGRTATHVVTGRARGRTRSPSPSTPWSERTP